MSRLINVSNRLPVRIDSSGTAHRTTGGLASALEGAELEQEQLWIGWPGRAVEDFEDLGVVHNAMEVEGMRPVFLTAAEIDGFYEGYANSTLWPLLHYMVERASFSNAWWHAYQRANERFAEVIVKEAKDGDMVWIHDYHLFLLPSLLREKTDKDLRVGFFLHTPFCSSDLFRVLPERAEILRGLLGADVIAFHTYGYLRHFRSSLLRVLGLESDVEGVWHGGRQVRLGVYPIGHNHLGFQREMARDEFAELVEKHRRELNGKRLILNVERLDYTKGVPEKLAAMRRFLETTPDKRNEVVFVLIAVPSRQGVEEYDLLTEEVQQGVGAINGDFGRVGHAPVQFLHRGFPMKDLAALYTLAEICLVTPLRDGMNLVAKEFIDCQDADGCPGVLILSEFTGATEELAQALQVNPYDVDAVSDALNRALDMTEDERRARIAPMQSRVRSQHSGVWARRYLHDLASVPEREKQVVVADMKPLAEDVVEKWRAGDRVGLFLDYDGTLRDFVDVPDEAVPDPGLPQLLQALASHDRLSLTIVSGRAPQFLETHFGGLGITLVAEHGYRWFEADGEEWTLFNPHVDTTWKDLIRAQLEQASLLTPGTHVEEKQSAMVWHYRQADPEFGRWRARELLDELTQTAANLPVTVHHGQKIVEVSSLQVSKGLAVDALMTRQRNDVAFVAGDDQTDETMFALEPKGVDFYTVKVGKASTRARYRTDITGVRLFLETLREEVERIHA